MPATAMRRLSAQRRHTSCGAPACLPGLTGLSRRRLAHARRASAAAHQMRPSPPRLVTVHLTPQARVHNLNATRHTVQVWRVSSRPNRLLLARSGEQAKRRGAARAWCPPGTRRRRSARTCTRRSSPRSWPPCWAWRLPQTAGLCCRSSSSPGWAARPVRRATQPR